MTKHTITRSPQAPTAPHKATLPVILLALATVISAVSSLMVALPSIAVHTHASQTELSWIVDAYSLAFAALLLPGGALGDRIGRRRVLVAGMALFTLASFVPLFTSSPDVLIAVRACLGVAAAMVMPATLSTITASFPPQQRVKAVATWAGVAGAGAIFGLLTSGLLLEWWSWRSVFVVSGILALVTLSGHSPSYRNPLRPRMLRVIWWAVSHRSPASACSSTPSSRGRPTAGHPRAPSSASR
ncbi:MFS transporter [Jongsikchunia kroppenstedtii]|uniref:MFS transporter n=1 Tax=Jongsikchunia kroppenstedtii TaxID=1121721 RepID=UPI001C9DCA42|nr:MFS transporter [Jongsikchunia kroppenstedtii]